MFLDFFGYERDISVSAAMLEQGVDHFSILMRKNCFSFIQRLKRSSNIILYTIISDNAFSYNNMNRKWKKLLCTSPQINLW